MSNYVYLEITSRSQKLSRCHQMSDFKAKMHQNRFRLGLCSDQIQKLAELPRPPICNKGDLLLREEWGAGRGRGEEGGEGKRR